MLRTYIIKAFVMSLLFVGPSIAYGLNIKIMNPTLNNLQPELPFDSLLNDIYSQVKGDWDPPVKLYSTRNFEYIYGKSSKYYVDIKRVLANPLYSENKKMICIYASQKLDFNKYLEFSNYCLKLFEKGLLTEDVFFNVIFPYEWKTNIRFIEKYKDKRVRCFLNAVLMVDNVSASNKTAIKEVISGQTLRRREKMLREM